VLVVGAAAVDGAGVVAGATVVVASEVELGAAFVEVDPDEQAALAKAVKMSIDTIRFNANLRGTRSLSPLNPRSPNQAHRKNWFYRAVITADRCRR